MLLNLRGSCSADSSNAPKSGTNVNQRILKVAVPFFPKNGRVTFRIRRLTFVPDLGAFPAAVLYFPVEQLKLPAWAYNTNWFTRIIAPSACASVNCRKSKRLSATWQGRWAALNAVSSAGDTGTWWWARGHQHWLRPTIYGRSRMRKVLRVFGPPIHG